MECSMVNHFRAVCRSMRHKAVNELEKQLDEYAEEDGQIDIMNMNLLTLMPKGQA